MKKKKIVTKYSAQWFNVQFALTSSFYHPWILILQILKEKEKLKPFTKTYNLMTLK